MVLTDITTPSFILDGGELERSVSLFREALARNFFSYEIGYSVKTNSLPYCLRYLRQLDISAEVVSSDEYLLALKCGYDRNKIIYNGPMKSKETFIDAVTNGAVVNIETKRELQWLRELPKKDKCYKVGIRLNINISKISPLDADADNDNSRFGFSDETEEFGDAVSFIKSLQNIELSGLHIHRTAHSRSPRFYEESIEYACQVIKKYNLMLSYLDIGGGYFGIFPKKPTYKDYCDAFFRVLKRNGFEKMHIIVEPGNALIASSFSFVTSVIDVKHVEDNTWFITTDGSRNDIDPFFRKNDYLYSLSNDRGNMQVPIQIISGCTCLENDRLFKLMNKPLLNIGDRIKYNNVGAYTMTLSPLFIRLFPAVYLYQDEKYSLIRGPWTIEEFIQK